MCSPWRPRRTLPAPPVSGEYPLAVQFTDTSAGDPTSWSWTFGDGGSSTAQNPAHTYTAAGSYTVSLTATNAQGSDTVTRTGYITVTEPGTGGSTMHVDSIVVSRVISGRKYYGHASVTIVDGSGAPVSGASVTGLLTGDITQTLSGVTGTDGTVELQATTKAYGNTEFCFEVTAVTHSSFDYDAAANSVTKACESGDVYGADGLRVLPAQFALSQNSPNPFNPMTRISFALPADSHVRLTVYNVRGQAVEVLADRTFGAGQHDVTWDARRHSSGVYFYRLEAPGFSETKKMIMLK